MKIAQVSLIVLGSMFMFSLAACGGTPEGTVPFEEGGPPAWFIERSDERDGLIYGYGRSGGEKSERLASEAAKAAAQLELAQFISTKVQGLFEQYLRDVGAGQAAEESRQTENALRTLTNQRIVGFRGDGKEGWNKSRTIYYYRGYLDFDALSKLGEAFKASSDLNKALDKVQADRDAFFNRLDDALKNGFDK